jgi:hypothetical protein
MTDDELSRMLNAALMAFGGELFSSAQAVSEIPEQHLPECTRIVLRRAGRTDLLFANDPAKSVGRWMSHRRDRSADGLHLEVIDGGHSFPNAYRVVEE